MTEEKIEEIEYKINSHKLVKELFKGLLIQLDKLLMMDGLLRNFDLELQFKLKDKNDKKKE